MCFLFQLSFAWIQMKSKWAKTMSKGIFLEKVWITNIIKWISLLFFFFFFYFFFWNNKIVLFYWSQKKLFFYINNIQTCNLSSTWTPLHLTGLFKNSISKTVFIFTWKFSYVATPKKSHNQMLVSFIGFALTFKKGK